MASKTSKKTSKEAEKAAAKAEKLAAKTKAALKAEKAKAKAKAEKLKERAKADAKKAKEREGTDIPVEPWSAPAQGDIVHATHVPWNGTTGDPDRRALAETAVSGFRTSFPHVSGHRFHLSR